MLVVAHREILARQWAVPFRVSIDASTSVIASYFPKFSFELCVLHNFFPFLDDAKIMLFF